MGIPARFMAVLRAVCPEQTEQVGVMITPDESIRVMPANYFEQEIERLSQLDDQVDDERMVLNLATSTAELLPLDKQNRIKLNPLMMEFCSIDRQVVFVGSLKYMQVFDVNKWRQMVNAGLKVYGKATTAIAARKAPAAPVNQFVLNVPGAGPNAPGA